MLYLNLFVGGPKGLFAAQCVEILNEEMSLPSFSQGLGCNEFQIHSTC